jgi:hypothetical protein
MYHRLMHGLEHRLHARDFAQRVVRPFEWGLEFLGAEGNGHAPSQPLEYLRQYNEKALEQSAEFFTPAPAQAADFAFDGFLLRYSSSVTTPYAQNNLVHARYYPAGNNDRAVIVSPQWNANEESHVALCRALNRFGISALRLSLPFHDWRRPPELQRADYMISANIGRTIQGVRQAVHDIRRAADWLFLQGVRRVGVMGSSIGSCVSWLSFIHDERLETGVFNMVSSYFGDVVWRAVTTAHIRQSLEAALTLETTRQVWLSLSPSFYADRMLKRVQRRSLLISARYDLSFVPDLSEIFINDCERHGVPVEKVFLPCGHYTIGRAPFKYLDAYHIVNFFRRVWK